MAGKGRGLEGWVGGSVSPKLVSSSSDLCHAKIRTHEKVEKLKKKKKKDPKVLLCLCPHPPPAVSMLHGPYPAAPAAFRALLPEIQLSDLLFLSGSYKGQALRCSSPPCHQQAEKNYDLGHTIQTGDTFATKKNQAKDP